jgi:fumarase (EC 4.2.1.2)
LTRHIGYAKAAEIARMAYKSDKTVKEVCLEMGVLDKKHWTGCLIQKMRFKFTFFHTIAKYNK